MRITLSEDKSGSFAVLDDDDDIILLLKDSDDGESDGVEEEDDEASSWPWSPFSIVSSKRSLT